MKTDNLPFSNTLRVLDDMRVREASYQKEINELRTLLHMHGVNSNYIKSYNANYADFIERLYRYRKKNV